MNRKIKEGIAFGIGVSVAILIFGLLLILAEHLHK